MSLNNRMRQEDDGQSGQNGQNGQHGQDGQEWGSPSEEEAHEQNDVSRNNSTNRNIDNNGGGGGGNIGVDIGIDMNMNMNINIDMGQQLPRDCSLEEAESKSRRESIKKIMTDPNLTNDQRRFSMQLLMDGRRRSSYGQTFAEAAKNVAAEFTECDDDDDDEEEEEEEEGTLDDSSHPISLDNTSASSATGKRRVSSDSGDSEFGAGTTTTNASAGANADNVVKNSSPPNMNIAYNTFTGEPTGDPKYLEQNRPQCSHYKRNCSIISPCCGMVFSCRLCHDECQSLSTPFMNGLRERFDCRKNNNDNDDDDDDDATAAAAAAAAARLSQETNEKCLIRKNSNSNRNRNRNKNRNSCKRTSSSRSLRDNAEDLHHEIDRFAISEVICRQCFTRQSSKTNHCINCGVQFGKYHCNICNLWMDDNDLPYHCEGCGICRIGGRDNFQHCFKCGICIDKSIFQDHSCQVGKYMSKCPVCYEDLFSSRTACHELPCKHSIHWHCFCNLLSVDIRCPICKKTMLSAEEKEDIWVGLREDIDAQPVPRDQTRVVDIFCNDCEIRDRFRRWHPLGVSCRNCSGFNTSLDITMVGVEAFNFLEGLERRERDNDGSAGNDGNDNDYDNNNADSNDLAEGR